MSDKSKRLAWYVISWQKDEFVLGGSLHHILQDFCGGQCPPITNKEEAFLFVTVIYKNTERNKDELWNLLAHEDHVSTRGTKDGLCELFKILVPQFTDEHLNIWMKKLLSLRLAMQCDSNSTLMCVVSGSKGFSKSTAIPTVIYIFLLANLPKTHKNEDLRLMIDSKLASDAKKKVASLLSDCKGVPDLEQLIYVSDNPRSAIDPLLSLM